MGWLVPRTARGGPGESAFTFSCRCSSESRPGYYHLQDTSSSYGSVGCLHPQRHRLEGFQDKVFHQHIEDKEHFTESIQESLPTNEHLHRKFPGKSASCPRCGNVPVDRDHVIKCQHSAAWQESTLAVLEKKCVDLCSRPGLLDILLTTLSRWMKDLPPLEAKHYPAVYHGVIRTQTMIGWRHVFSDVCPKSGPSYRMIFSVTVKLH